MSRSMAKILSVICMIATIVICFILAALKNEAAVAIVFIIYIPIAIVLNYFQRCKSCGRWPGKGDFWNEYCPCCGEPLDD